MDRPQRAKKDEDRLRLKQLMEAQRSGSGSDSDGNSDGNSGSPPSSDREWSPDEESGDADGSGDAEESGEYEESEDDSEELAWSEDDDEDDWPDDYAEEAKLDREEMLKLNVFQGQKELLRNDALSEDQQQQLFHVLSAVAWPNESVRCSQGWLSDVQSELQPDANPAADYLAAKYRARVIGGMRQVAHDVEARVGRVPRWLRFQLQSSDFLVRLGSRVLLARAVTDAVNVLPDGVPDAPQLDRVEMAKDMIAAKYADLDGSQLFAQFFILAGFALADTDVAARFAALEADGRFRRQPVVAGAVARPKATVLGSRWVKIPGRLNVRILLFQPGQDRPGVVVYAHLPVGTQCMGLHAALLEHAEAMNPPQPAYVAFLQNTFATHAICNSPEGSSRAPPDGRVIELECMGTLPLPADKKGRVFLVAVESGAAVRELSVRLKAVCLMIKRKENKKRKRQGELREEVMDRVFLKASRMRILKLNISLGPVRSSFGKLQGMLQDELQVIAPGSGFSVPPLSDAGWRFGQLSTAGLAEDDHSYVNRGSLEDCVERLRCMRFRSLEKLLLGCIGVGKPPLIVARYCIGNKLVQPPSATDPMRIKESLSEDGRVRTIPV